MSLASTRPVSKFADTLPDKWTGPEASRGVRMSPRTSPEASLGVRTSPRTSPDDSRGVRTSPWTSPEASGGVRTSPRTSPEASQGGPDESTDQSGRLPGGPDEPTDRSGRLPRGAGAVKRPMILSGLSSYWRVAIFTIDSNSAPVAYCPIFGQSTVTSRKSWPGSRSRGGLGGGSHAEPEPE